MTAACSISGFCGWTSAFGGSTAAILSSGRAGSCDNDSRSSAPLLDRRSDPRRLPPGGILVAPLRLVSVFFGGLRGSGRLLFGLLLAGRAIAKLFELA